MSVLLALVAVLLLVLYLLQRRELRAVAAMSREVQRVAIGGRLSDRVDLQTDQPELAALGTAINHLLARVGAQSDRERLSPVLFADLGDRIHEVVIVHREVILYANRQFANLVGVERAVLPGRRLADIVAADSAELVEENLRRKLAGEATADRYEIDIIGLQGSASRLEIATTVIDYDGGPAVLVTGVEVVPTQTVPALRAPPLADAAEPGEPAPGRTPARDDALESLAEGIVVTDARGQIEYMNAAAEALTGTTRIEAQGRRFEDIVSLVDETERRAITDPVRHAIESGAAVRAPRRALLVARDSGEERAIEPLTSPLRDAGGNVTGTVVLLHDVTELRGMARQMSYQATHDALTGLVNRREFERRLE
ncbi:MAG: PAS domain-containing protein, partial [Steroidobacteraceae bacterium]